MIDYTLSSSDCFTGGCLPGLRQVQGSLNVAEGEECLHDPLGYYPWLANEGRQEKKILNMEHLSFDAGERMTQFGWSPAQ